MNRTPLFLSVFLGFLLSLLLPGCSDEPPVATYTTPKEMLEAPIPAEPLDAPTTDPDAPSMTDILPTGWTPQPVQPGSPRLAAFRVVAPDDPNLAGDVVITSFSGLNTDALMNVNRWRAGRDGLGLPPIDDIERIEYLAGIDPASLPIYFNQNDEEFIAALMHSIGDNTITYLFRGPNALLDSQAAPFAEFVRDSINPPTKPPSPDPAPAEPNE